MKKSGTFLPLFFIEAYLFPTYYLNDIFRQLLTDQTGMKLEASLQDIQRKT